MIVTIILTTTYAHMFYRVAVGGVWGTVEYLGRIPRATYDAMSEAEREAALVAAAQAQYADQTASRVSLVYTGYAQL